MDNTEAQRVYAHKTQNGRKKAKKKKRKKKATKNPQKQTNTQNPPQKTRKIQSSNTGSIKNRWYTPGAEKGFKDKQWSTKHYTDN